MKPTYCNPLPIPDVDDGRKIDAALTGHKEDEYTDYRSVSDPSVLYWDGKWILYPSYRVAYVTEDFVHWKHVDIGLHDLGYSPAVTMFRGKCYLYGAHFSSDVYRADTPLSKFEKIGEMTDMHGKPVRWTDGCLFADGDRLYTYWCGSCAVPADMDLEYRTCTYGAELDPDRPWQMISEPVLINAYEPQYTWQRLGEYNQNERVGWIEGQWMVRRGGRYYLMYSGCGTEFSTYANGILYSDESPLSGFHKQEYHDPFTQKRTGLLRGAGHGCLAEGPEDTLWVFYTNTFCYNHMYERRISMDPVGIDEHGELYVNALTETPQLAPGVLLHPECGNDAGLLPLTFMQRPTASSHAPGRDAIYACDDSVLSFWQPAEDDPAPVLEIPFTVGYTSSFLVSAVRIIWRDIGMEVKDGILPGAFRYAVEYLDGGEWKMLVDAAENTDDLCVDYRTFETVCAVSVRLRILGAPKGITPGVVSLTAFGVCNVKR